MPASVSASKKKPSGQTTYNGISTSAILYYDYSLTFTREVRLIWMRKFGYISVLYFVCRYAMLSNMLFLMLMIGALPSVCIISSTLSCLH